MLRKEGMRKRKEELLIKTQNLKEPHRKYRGKVRRPRQRRHPRDEVVRLKSAFLDEEKMDCLANMSNQKTRLHRSFSLGDVSPEKMQRYEQRTNEDKDGKAPGKRKRTNVRKLSVPK